MDNTIEIEEEVVNQGWELTRKLVEDCFPRITGSKTNYLASNLIEKDFQTFSKSVTRQSFQHKPDGFLKFIPYAVILHLIGISLLFAELYLLSSLLFLIVIVVYSSQLIFYKGWFDFPFATKTGENIISTIEPKETPQRQVILSAHYDAPYVFQLLENYPKWYTSIVGIGLVTIIIGLLGSITFLIIEIIFGIEPSNTVSLLFTILISILSIPILFNLRFTSDEVSPGAGDNAIAIGIISGVGKSLKKYSLKSTRVIILALDAEEAGLNGARAYVKEYKDMFTKIPTFNLNIDSVFDLEDLKIFTKDLNSTIALSDEETDIVRNLSIKLGNELNLRKMPFGGGSTDAAEFSKGGVTSVTIVGVDEQSIAKSGYHTSNDDMDAISKESLSFLIKLTLSYLFQKDQ